MRKLLLIVSLFGIGFSCNDDSADHSAGHNGEKPVILTKTKEGGTDTVKKSIPALVQNKTSSADLKIFYHSPAVRGRIIWGGLVPYEQVWVTGAHKATRLESNQPFILGHTTISPGKYAPFTIPSQNEWTILLNKNWDQHLADEYTMDEDVVRLQVKPDTLSYSQERLMYEIEQRAEKAGNIIITWEKLRIVIPIRIS